jgi:hypothetical protein
VGVALLVLLALGGASAPGAEAFVYWAHSPGAIGRAELDGITAKTQSFITGANGPWGVAVDAAHVYWTNVGNGTIGRANLDGTGANQSFITGANLPTGVAVDAAHIYWTNNGNGTIGRAELDGTTAKTQSYITGANGPWGVAVDAGYVYWTNAGNGTIGRANLRGITTKNQSFVTGADGPRGVAVDAAHIYWANNGNGAIGRAELDGTTAKTQSFVTGADGPRGVAVDAAHIYWANYDNGTIGRATLDGTVVNPSFVTGASSPYGVAVDALPLPPSSPGTTPGTTPGTLPLPVASVRATISALSQTHRVFAVGATSTPLTGRTTLRRPRGTTFTFRLDQPAIVTVRIQRKLPGRRVGRVCRRPTAQLRRRPRCTRLLLKATLRRSARTGLNKIRFTGRIRGRALKPGRYRAAFTAANTAGTSAPRALSFAIVAP